VQAFASGVSHGGDFCLDHFDLRSWRVSDAVVVVVVVDADGQGGTNWADK